MKAIKIQDGNKAMIVDVPIPQLRPNHVLVKTVAVALNPTDWKHIAIMPSTEGCTAGCDFAGVVEKVGANVLSLKAGDRIAGWTHGGNISNKEDGSFAEYLVAKAGIQFKIPEDVSYEEAATFGVGITTVGQSLYQSLELPLPSLSQPCGERMPLLVYGGSTATGALAIQFGKLSGLDIVATCSPSNFSMVKALGASAVFDYNSLTVGAEIRTYTGNKLYHAFDCISEGSSAQICAEALSDDTAAKKPIYSALLFGKFPRNDVEAKFTLAYTAFGETFEKPIGPGIFPASKEDYEFNKMFWELSRELLAEGKIKAHRQEVRDGGLAGVLDGLKDLEQGKISGKKLVYKL